MEKTLSRRWIIQTKQSNVLCYRRGKDCLHGMLKNDKLPAGAYWFGTPELAEYYIAINLIGKFPLAEFFTKEIFLKGNHYFVGNK